MASSKLRATRAPMLPFAIPAGVPFDAFAPSMIPNHGLVVRGPADRVHPSDRSGREIDCKPAQPISVDPRTLYTREGERPRPLSGRGETPAQGHRQNCLLVVQPAADVRLKRGGG